MSGIIMFNPKHPPPSITNIFEIKFNKFLQENQTNRSQEQNVKYSHMNLGSAKADLIKCKEFLKELKFQKNNHLSLINNYNDLTSKCDTTTTILNKYESPEVVKHLKKSIAKRTKKQKRFKKCKGIRKLAAANLRHDIVMKHKQIDRKIKAQCFQEQKTKEREEEKLRVPQVLIGVAKKKADAQRYLCLLESLSELRERKTQADRRYDHKGQREFAKKIDLLKAVWKEAIRNYQKEEAELRKFISFGENVKFEWNTSLFGNDKGNALLKETTTLKELLQIRCLWDYWLVDETNRMGSSIPLGLVMPNENPSTKWARYKTNI